MSATHTATVLHVITGLGAGGAEAMLVKLVDRLDRARFRSEVVSLLPGGVNVGRLQAIGVPVFSLNMEKGAADPRALVRLSRLVRRRRPDLVQSWMYHADLLGGLAAEATQTPVVWNIQNSCLPPAPKWHTRLACEASARLSTTIPERIVVCSQAGADWHAQQGYARQKMVKIENGIDAQRFRPSSAERAQVRAELRLDDEMPVIVVPARFAPEKDHATLLDATRLLVDRERSFRLALCGDGTGAGNPALDRRVDERGLADHVLRLGRRDDMPRLLNGFDIACLSSSHVEAFSNALGEAMATGLACVATEVGDALPMLGAPERVPPPRDPAALADALDRLIALTPADRRQEGQRLRDRIVERFSLERTVALYEGLYAEILRR